MGKMSPVFLEVIFYVIRSVKALSTTNTINKYLSLLLLYYPFGAIWKETDRVLIVRDGNLDRDGSMGEEITCTKAQGGIFAEDRRSDNHWGVCWARVHG